MGRSQFNPHPRNRKNEEMKIVFALLIVAISHGSSFTQTQKTGAAKSSGACSPAVTGNNNTFTITYCGDNPDEQKKILKVLNALVNGEDVTNYKLDQILEILSMPIKITTSNFMAVDAAPGGHPRAKVDFYTDDPVDRGQFEIVCDRACIPIDVCNLLGSNSTIFATVLNQPDLAEFLFQRQFPALTKCTLTVESRDEKPINIIKLLISKRTANLVVEAVQPPHSVTTDRSTIR